MRILGQARRTRQALVLAGAGALAVALVPLPGSAQASTSEGMDCESSPSATFDLSSQAGYISTPDGNSIYTWSYAVDGQAFQLPGPSLCVRSGDRVTVRLRNTLREPVSIVFPGQTGVRADGVPSQPVLGATPNDPVTSLAPTAAANGGTVTYTFTAAEPGTYLYESGTDQEKQVQMGLYGALVVRPALHPDRAYDRADSQFDPAHEYLHLLSEIDPALHLAVERNRAFDFATYRPRYFLINGRSMPDTIAPNRAPWLPAQPYGSMVHIKPYDASTNQLPALIRYVNVGTQTYPFHPHGNDQRVIGRDGRPLAGAGGEDLSYEKFLVDIGPGQTVDTTLLWTDAEKWDPVTNPLPSSVTLPPLADQLVSPDTWFSESPYLGRTGDLPAGVTSLNQCGEYYHVAHSHALQQATNYGASFGGMMTLIRIDPPAGCPTAP